MSDGRVVRYRCELDARIETEGGRIAAKILDISKIGAFVETELDFQVDDEFRLGMALPGGDPLFVPVSVVRVGFGVRDLRHPKVDNMTLRRPGVQVRFVDMPAEDLPRLEGFLELLDER